ncbi:hypothetical protein KJA16_00225 [Patescibacteria group bacterium]|nr:hypothetical protein [Patescibacteria group bacterium]
MSEEKEKIQEKLRELWKSHKKYQEKFPGVKREVKYIMIPMKGLSLFWKRGSDGKLIKTPAVGGIKEQNNSSQVEIMIVIAEEIPKKFQRYVVYHEWVEAISVSERTLREEDCLASLFLHASATEAEIELAKKELSKEEFNSYLLWRLRKELDSPILRRKSSLKIKLLARLGHLIDR